MVHQGDPGWAWLTEILRAQASQIQHPFADPSWKDPERWVPGYTWPSLKAVTQGETRPKVDGVHFMRPSPGLTPASTIFSVLANFLELN